MKTLKELRAFLAQLAARAALKLGEIKDDTAPDAARAIETEHAGILAEMESVRAQIAQRVAAGETDEDAADDDDDEERAAPPADQAEAIRTAVDAHLRLDRERTQQIGDIGRRFGMPADFVNGHILRNSTVEQVRTAVLDHLATRSDQTRSFPHVEVAGQEEGTSRRAGMSAAITARLARASGQRNVEVPAHARAFEGRELVDLAAECIGHRGAIRTARQMTEVFERAFHTTSDFPAIFTDALNNRLAARYETAAPTYRRFASRYMTPDFRETNVIRAGDFPALQPINDAGEIKSGTFGESKEAVQTKPYGVKMTITRQMLINDQLQAIDQVLASAGIRVSDWENQLVYAALVSGGGAGPTLKTDNKRVFHADHGNLAGAGGAISVTTIGAGRAAMAKQKTLDGINANFQPVTILCGPDTITVAEQLVATITPAAQANAVPESIRRLVPVSDANLSGNGWYLFADPMVAPVFVYSYLEGYEAPRLTSEDVFDVQGMRVKLEHDFGCGAIDYRGGYKNGG